MGGGAVVIGWDNLPSPVRIGLTDLQNIGEASGHRGHPGSGITALSTPRFIHLTTALQFYVITLFVQLTFVSEIHNPKTIQVIFGNIALVERYLINDPVDRI